jgi:hypothetical protein
MLARWFTPVQGGRPAYIDRLQAALSTDEIARIRSLLERQLSGQTVAWAGATLFLTARRA